MSEKIPGVKTQQQRVFGDGFDLEMGIVDEQSLASFFIERQDRVIENGGYGWLPEDIQDLKAGNDIKIYLYRDYKIFAKLDFDHETGLADVHVVAKSGQTDLSLFLGHVPFDVAVDMAEQYVSTIDSHPRLFEVNSL